MEKKEKKKEGKVGFYASTNMVLAFKPPARLAPYPGIRSACTLLIPVFIHDISTFIKSKCVYWFVGLLFTGA